MPLINVCQDKLAAAQSVFTQKGMMQGLTLAYMISSHGEHSPPLPTNEENRCDDHGVVTGPHVMNAVNLATAPGESPYLL